MPPAEAPKVMRLLSETLANAQSRISTAEAQRDSAQVRLRQAESLRKNDLRITTDRTDQHTEAIKETRRQRDEAMAEVNGLHHALQKMKVQQSVNSATANFGAGGGGGNPAMNVTDSRSGEIRDALQKEFDEKKNILEQRWDHALHLVTDQMKKQRDEQVSAIHM